MITAVTNVERMKEKHVTWEWEERQLMKSHLCYLYSGQCLTQL
jgi:hypothetical protein